jgi:hypothetical protein
VTAKAEARLRRLLKGSYDTGRRRKGARFVDIITRTWAIEEKTTGPHTTINLKAWWQKTIDVALQRGRRPLLLLNAHWAAEPLVVMSLRDFLALSPVAIPGQEKP